MQTLQDRDNGYDRPDVVIAEIRMTFGGSLSGLEDWRSIVHEAELPEQSGQTVPDINSSLPGRMFMHRRARG